MGLKIGSLAKIACDAQGDLAQSLIGKSCRILGRVRGQDVEGDKAYAALAEGRKNPKTFWQSELEPNRRKKK